MKIAFVALAVLAAPAAALAAPQMEAVFGNTIVSTYPDGRTAYLWLKADGTYSLLNRKRETSGGAWALKGERVCLRQSTPMPMPITYCTPAPEGDGAAPWPAKALTGEKVFLKVVKGIVR